MKREPYAPASATAALLRAGQAYQRERLGAADMITVHEAASFLDVDGADITAWIQRGRCIGIADLNGKVKLPRWQFDPSVWPLIERINECLDTADGWQTLNFLESRAPALNGLTPRAALEQGQPIARVLEAAVGESL